MKRKELKLIGLSYSQSQVGSYVVVLSDIDSDLKLPIVIKAQEAHKIAMELDSVRTPSPMVYDLFMNLSQNFNIDLTEVFIYNLIEGKFYADLVFSDQVDDCKIEASAGEALALAVMYGCPIYVSIDVLRKAGVYIDNDGTVIENSDLEKDFIKELEKTDENSRIVSIENLEKMIEEAILSEEYEVAAELRDKIDELKSNSK